MDELTDEIQARMAEMARLPAEMSGLDMPKLMTHVTEIAEKQAQEHVVFCMEKLKEIEEKTNGRMNDIDTTLRRVHEFATNARDDMVAMRKDILAKVEHIGSKEARRTQARPEYRLYNRNPVPPHSYKIRQGGARGREGQGGTRAKAQRHTMLQVWE